MIMASADTDTPEFTSILSSAKTRSRLVAIVALLGIVAVFASLVTLYILASNRAELAEQREQVAKENARAISDQLERIRSAYARGDMSRVGLA
jgi:flagellar basal body-associated protein FliL